MRMDVWPRSRCRDVYKIGILDDTFNPGHLALVIVTLLVWIAALFIPSGAYQEAPDGTPIPGSYHRVPSPLSFGGKLSQLILAPVNGTYGLKNPATGVVDTETLGRLFGQIGVIFFIMAIGAFISVSFSTKALDTAVAALATLWIIRGAPALSRSLRPVLAARTDSADLLPVRRRHHSTPRPISIPVRTSLL